MKDTALVRVPLWAIEKITSRFIRKPPTFVNDDEEEEEEVVESSSSGADDFEVLEQVKTTAQNGTGKATKRNKKSARGR